MWEFLSIAITFSAPHYLYLSLCVCTCITYNDLAMMSVFIFLKNCIIGIVITCFLALDKLIYRKVYFYLVVSTE